MKSILRRVITGVLAGGMLLCGTAGYAADNTYSLPLGGVYSSTEETSEITLVISSGNNEITEILAQLAHEDGNSLRVVRLPQGVGYAGHLEEYLQEQPPADLFWVEDGMDMSALGEYSEELTGRNVHPGTVALANMLPQSERVAGERASDEPQVLGLPLGFYAEGYLVNLQLLGGLLGTDNLIGLQSDLEKASWEQWSVLAQVLDAYLLQPGTYAVSLGSTNYVTPTYRPTDAQQLRGVFAVPTLDAHALLEGALDTALIVGFGGAQHYEQASEEQLSERLWGGLTAMAGLLDLESSYMTAPDGPVRRGEDYLAREKASAEQAYDMFVQGNALFLRSSSMVGAQIEAENPQLSGYLSLVPIKMPPPEEQEPVPEEQEPPEDEATFDESGTQDEQSSSAAEDASDASEDDQPEEWEYDIAQGIQSANERLIYTSGGFLCLSKDAQNSQAAQALLMRLFTTQQGISAISEGLGLLPFTLIYPNSPLQNQVATAVGGRGIKMIVAPQQTYDAKTELGIFIREELFSVGEWAEEEEAAYMAAAYAALGYHIELAIRE